MPMTRRAFVATVPPLAALAMGAAPAPPRPRVVADRLFTVADDFVIDVYHNGAKVPDHRRTLLHEIHGATAERIDLELREGDWLVLNVVNNRMRWGGCSYFGAVARGESGVAFATEAESGRWTACDDTERVAEFIADRDYMAGTVHRANPIANPWSEGDGLLKTIADHGGARPVWGRTSNTWIKVVAR